MMNTMNMSIQMLKTTQEQREAELQKLRTDLEQAHSQLTVAHSQLAQALLTIKELKKEKKRESVQSTHQHRNEVRNHKKIVYVLKDFETIYELMTS